MRLLADGAFEPLVPPIDGRTAFAGAIVDTGAPYVIIPHILHRAGHIKVYTDLGSQPYRVLSMSGAPLMQPFVEVGLCFLAKGDAGAFAYRPAPCVPVKAYLLEQNVSPIRRVVIGLDAIRTHLPLYADGNRAFFLEPGESAQIP
ncbi:MAG: hypothetical protein IT429_08805 [Gemmataceae bacterium]|nr:hypothetical protein [Gemmataceae bacterium]